MLSRPKRIVIDLNVEEILSTELQIPRRLKKCSQN